MFLLAKMHESTVSNVVWEAKTPRFVFFPQQPFSINQHKSHHMEVGKNYTTAGF